MKLTLPCLIASLAPLVAHAACEDHLQTWSAQLHPGRALDTEHAVCKVWPANEALTIAALPLPQKNNTDDEGTDDLEVLVADTATGAIIAHAFENAAIQYDAISFSGLDIDTARYQLTPQLRAFGVRVGHEHNSRASPYSMTSLNLYTVDGPHLRRVLTRLTVSELRAEYDANGSGSSDEIQRTLEIGPAGKDGYAVLKVKEQSVHTVNDSDGGATDKPAKHSTYSLDYRDGSYPLPAKLQQAY
jgi:hypothetical protein